MSNVKQVHKLWLATCEDIADVRTREQIQRTMQPETEILGAHRTFATLYARYVRIVNRIGEIYDQTLQVQKRDVVRAVLVSTTQRLQELRVQLQTIEMSEFVYVDRQLIEEKWAVEEVELLSPFYYPMVRPGEVQDLIGGLNRVASVEELVESEEEDDEDEFETGAPKKMSKIDRLIAERKRLAEEEANRVEPYDEAIQILQSHEKARQARCLFFYMRLHPDEYWPKPPPADDMYWYQFYHKPDTPMAIVVKRTNYESNYCKKLRSFDDHVWYIDPRRTAAELATSRPQSASDSDEDADGDAEQKDAVDDQKADGPVDEAEPDEDDLSDEDDDNAETETASQLERRLRDEELKLHNEAATKIQRCFLLWQIKRRVRYRNFMRQVQLGMAELRRFDKHAPHEREKAARLHVSQHKAAFDAALLKAVEDMRNRIVVMRSEWLAEDISDHIRAWFRDMWVGGGEREFDKYPPAAKGGTILVLRGETDSPQEFYAKLEAQAKEGMMTPEKKAKLKEAAKAAKKAERKAKLEARKAKKKFKADRKKEIAKAGGRLWFFDDDTFNTKNAAALEQQMDVFARDWRFIDEPANRFQVPYLEWIEEEEMAKVHLELRPQIDEVMRVEFELLQMARAFDFGKKYKKPRAAKGGKGKGKKGKKGKKTKEPAPIEFGERTKEKVYDLMVKNGAICVADGRRYMDEFIGDRRYGNQEYRQLADTNPLHGQGEVCDVLRLCALGMGDVQFKHPKSVLLTGPPGCGKKLMIDALIQEIGAVKIDLTAEVCTKYANDMAEFVKDVMKMARLLQPTVLFIDDAHNPFIKKIAPEQAERMPKLLGPYLLKMVKQIKPTDRIMLLGSTSEPWNCAAAKMKKCYEKILLLPGADYNTTFMVWRNAVDELIDDGPARLIDMSALTKVCTNYGVEQMMRASERVINMERRVTMERRPLETKELLEDLLVGAAPNLPMAEKDQLKYTKFFNNNKFAKVRAKYDRAKAAKAAKKSK